jgi:hypothetical protein
MKCQEHVDPHGTVCGLPARTHVSYVDEDGNGQSYPVCDGHALGIALVDAQRRGQGAN